MVYCVVFISLRFAVGNHLRASWEKSLGIKSTVNANTVPPSSCVYLCFLLGVVVLYVIFSNFPDGYFLMSH